MSDLECTGDSVVRRTLVISRCAVGEVSEVVVTLHAPDRPGHLVAIAYGDRPDCRLDGIGLWVGRTVFELAACEFDAVRSFLALDPANEVIHANALPVEGSRVGDGK